MPFCQKYNPQFRVSNHFHNLGSHIQSVLGQSDKRHPLESRSSLLKTARSLQKSPGSFSAHPSAEALARTTTSILEVHLIWISVRRVEQNLAVEASNIGKAELMPKQKLCMAARSLAWTKLEVRIPMHDRSYSKALNRLTLSGESCRIHSNQAPKGVEEWSPRVTCPEDTVFVSTDIDSQEESICPRKFLPTFWQSVV
jgi:hypothetical protein